MHTDSGPDALMDPVSHPLMLTALADNSEMIAAADEYAKRKKEIEEKTEEFFQNVRICNNIWFVCFLDGTGSMAECLKQVKGALEKMVRRL